MALMTCILTVALALAAARSSLRRRAAMPPATPSLRLDAAGDGAAEKAQVY